MMLYILILHDDWMLCCGLGWLEWADFAYWQITDLALIYQRTWNYQQNKM